MWPFRSLWQLPSQWWEQQDHPRRQPPPIQYTPADNPITAAERVYRDRHENLRREISERRRVIAMLLLAAPKGEVFVSDVVRHAVMGPLDDFEVTRYEVLGPEPGMLWRIRRKSEARRG